jgi:hypothetical protein
MLRALLTSLVLVLATPAQADPYACYGGGRYDAMRDGLEGCPPDVPRWNVKALLSKYNCAWVRDQRKIYSDDELLARAKRLQLPEVVINMAKGCPK